MSAKGVFVALGIVLTLTLSAASGPMEDGIAAYDKEDYATALRIFQPLAERGHLDAQYSLGSLYQAGKGVAQDLSQSIVWYRKAADQGHVQAMTALGVILGDSPRENFIEALAWFNVAVARTSPSDDKHAGTRKIAEEGQKELSARMSPSQITAAQRLAHEWKPK